MPSSIQSSDGGNSRGRSRREFSAGLFREGRACQGVSVAELMARPAGLTHGGFLRPL